MLQRNTIRFIEEKYRNDPAFVWVTTVTYDDGTEEFAGFHFCRGSAMDDADDAPYSEYLSGDYDSIVRVTVARVPVADVARLVGPTPPVNGAAATDTNRRPRTATKKTTFETA
ncbi:MAG: hypothetical protein U0746_11825 [Gemmataceae bacterium]